VHPAHIKEEKREKKRTDALGFVEQEATNAAPNATAPMIPKVMRAARMELVVAPKL